MKGCFAALLVALFIIAMHGVSWIVTCGVFKLITLCFGWTFSWPVATGVWLVMCVLATMIKRK